jgi:hypothetical protein
MEMRTYRGPSAEDHQHISPTPNDSKCTTTSMTSLVTTDDSVITRKCCTLCNLLVRIHRASARSSNSDMCVSCTFQLASDLHLQTHLRGTRHNQLLIERFNQKTDNNSTKRAPKHDEIVRDDDTHRQIQSHSMIAIVIVFVCMCVVFCLGCIQYGMYCCCYQ